MAFNDHSPNSPFHHPATSSCHQIEHNLLLYTSDSIHHSFDHWDHPYCALPPHWNNFGPPQSYEEFDCPPATWKNCTGGSDQQGIISQSVLEAFIPPRHQFSPTKLLTPERQPKQDDGSNIIWELRSNDIGK